MVEYMSPACQASLLAALEKTIEKGLDGFLRVGAALAEIRDRRLYKHDYKTFDAYCVKRWNMRRAHAYRLIQAEQVVNSLSPNGRQINERQARELGRVRRKIA